MGNVARMHKHNVGIVQLSPNPDSGTYHYMATKLFHGVLYESSMSIGGKQGIRYVVSP